MEVMDSVLYNQLSNRFIYPDFLCVEVVNSNDSVNISISQSSHYIAFDICPDRIVKGYEIIDIVQSDG